MSGPKEMMLESLKDPAEYAVFRVALRFHDACKRAYKGKAFRPVSGLRAGKLVYANQLRSETLWIEVVFVDGEVQVYAVPLDMRPPPRLRSDATPSRYSGDPTITFRMCEPDFDAQLVDHITRQMGKPMAQDWMTAAGSAECVDGGQRESRSEKHARQ